MKITFLLPCTGLAGGIRIVVQYANGLLERGYDVSIVAPYYPYKPTPGESNHSPWIKWLMFNSYAKFNSFIGQDHLNNFKGRLIHPLTLEEKNIPDGDIIIATAWETAEWVTTFSKVKGKKVYYIQHYETWSGPKERVDATWQLPIAKIVIARWLKELGEREFNAKIIGPLFNPVDTNLFYPEGKRVHRGLRVGMLHHPAKWKGLEDGLEAFRIAREAVPSLKLVMISAQRRINIVPKDVEFHLRPVQSELRKIYSSCDIWMCSSWSEGYHLMPFEAMACGCALVSTLIGGVEDSCADGVNALLSPSRDPQKMAENLIKVAKNDKLRNRLVANGFYVIKSITWKKQIIQFETILHKILKSNAEEIDDPVNNYSK